MAHKVFLTFFVAASISFSFIILEQHGAFLADADSSSEGFGCILKYYPGAQSPVCVCNATYCDRVPDVGVLGSDEAVVYTTSRAGQRFERTTAKIDEISQPPLPMNTNVEISLEPERIYQTVVGFGGAFTDAAGVNLNRLSPESRRNLLQSYFDPNIGIGYNLARVIVASADFSTSVYSYDGTDPGACVAIAEALNANSLLAVLQILTTDPNKLWPPSVINSTLFSLVGTDFPLKNFHLADADYQFKIPHIKEALNMSNWNLKLFATPFSAPGWMKTSNCMIGGGPLKGNVDANYCPSFLHDNCNYYQAYADYTVRFFEEYAHPDINITFWGLTMQNEPMVSMMPVWWQGTFFSADMQKDYLKKRLGPAMRASNAAKDVKILIMDDQRNYLPNFTEAILSDPEAAQYVYGIGVHWYFDSFTNASLLDAAYKNPWKTNIPIIGTEASQGYLPTVVLGGGPQLGSWDRAVNYAKDIIEDLQHFVGGWTEWNLCLDELGGPTWVGTTIHGLDSPIIVNGTSDGNRGNDEFYKQPTFYVLGHFSAFIRPDSVRIDMNITAIDLSECPSGNGIDGVAFLDRSLNRITAVLHNTCSEQLVVSLHWPASNGSSVNQLKTTITLSGDSITNVLWNWAGP